ncbi:MAG: zinc-ribbon domain-containing protein [Syntrophaceae bacterium]
MALKKCKECGNEVSTKADKCPHCGAKVKGNIGCLGLIGIFILIGMFGSQVSIFL